MEALSFYGPVDAIRLIKRGWVLPIGGGAPTLDELEERQVEIKARIRSINEGAKQQARQLTDEERSEWNALGDELERNEATITEWKDRETWVSELAARDNHKEQGATFRTQAARSQAAREDLWDLTTVRSGDPTVEGQARELRDRCKRALENEWTFPQEEVVRGAVREDFIKSHINGLLERSDDDNGQLANYMLVHGSPQYKRAFGKYMVKGLDDLSREERLLLTGAKDRAMSVSTGSQGGYALPITIDPTIIPISNGVVNPLRKLASIETITALEYRALTAGAVVASYAPEGTEATDNSPTFAQPDFFAERAQAFVPYSIEIGMDWAGLLPGLAKLIGEAKDILEGNKFTLGQGHTNNEPAGLLTGATDTVATATTATFALADLYSLEQALPPRFRPMGQFFGNRAIYNAVRQFGASATNELWQPLLNPNVGPLGIGLDNNPWEAGGNLGTKLLGYGANEVSDMVTTTTTGSSILVLGDPKMYRIVDRIGMTVEMIPTLFGPNRRPTGQRGMFAYWRNTAGVIDPNAFRTLVVS